MPRSRCAPFMPLPGPAAPSAAGRDQGVARGSGAESLARAGRLVAPPVPAIPPGLAGVKALLAQVGASQWCIATVDGRAPRAAAFSGAFAIEGVGRASPVLNH